MWISQIGGSLSGPWTSCTSITQELVRNATSASPTQTYWVQDPQRTIYTLKSEKYCSRPSFFKAGALLIFVSPALSTVPGT